MPKSTQLRLREQQRHGQPTCRPMLILQYCGTVLMVYQAPAVKVVDLRNGDVLPSVCSSIA